MFSTVRKEKIPTLTLFFMVALVSGCNSGSSGGGESENGSVPPDEYRVKGTSPVSNGEVKVYEWAGAKGAVIGKASTDMDGRFELPVSDLPVLITVSNGSYHEVAAGTTVNLEHDLTALVADPGDESSSITVPVTALTSISHGLASHYSSVGSDSPLKAARSDLADVLGFNPYSVTPNHINQMPSETNEIDQRVYYGFLEGSFSKMAERILDQAGIQDSSRVTSARVADIMRRDIRHNGILDGQGANGSLSLEGQTLSSDYYVSEMARAVAFLAEGARNKTGYSRSDVFAIAYEFDPSNSDLFEDGTVSPFDNDGPFIFNVDPGSHSISEATKIEGDVSDAFGVVRTELIHSNNVISSSSGSGRFEFPLDPTDIDKGENTLTILSENSLGNISKHQFNIYRISSDDVDLEISHCDNLIRGEVGLFADIYKGSNVTINTVEFFLADKNKIKEYDNEDRLSEAFQTDSIDDGEVLFKVRLDIENSDSVESQCPVYVDNERPEIQIGPEDGDYISGTFTFSASISDNNKGIGLNLFLDGVSSDNTEYSENQIEYEKDISTEKYEESLTIALEAEDSAGNMNVSSVDLNVLNSETDVVLNNPEEGDVVNESFTMSAWVDDYHEVDNDAEFYVDDEFYSSDTVNRNSLSSELNVNNFENGEHEIEIRINNKAGIKSSDSASIIIDK